MARTLSVFKYGGSSVGNADAIKTVCQYIANTSETCIPVVSAMYGITDVLLSKDAKPDAKREQVVEIHKAAARELLEGNSYRADRCSTVKVVPLTKPVTVIPSPL